MRPQVENSSKLNRYSDLLRAPLLIFVWLVLTFSAGAQDLYRFGLLPTFNTNFKLQNGYSLNAKLENRHIVNEGAFNSDIRNSEYQFERQDLALIGAKKISASGVIGLGYMIRIESGRFIHRTTQQVSFTQPLYRLRIAHRFCTDQTWDPEEPFEFRARYRVGLEYPLFGTELDPNELYLKSTLEYLARFQDGFINEFRAVPVLGYFGKDKNSFELGLDYRFANVFDEARGHGYWIYLGYFLRIP